MLSKALESFGIPDLPDRRFDSQTQENKPEKIGRCADPATQLESFLDDLTLHLTEKCNLGCRYCFQKRRTHSLKFSSIRKILDFFQDALRPRSYIGFYGGEPLLAYETIRRTVAYVRNHATLKKKKLRYTISTNGTLLSGEILRFFASHKFRVNLSHDGTAQDITRPSPLNSLILENLNRLTRLPGIEFETNSVFVPATVGELYRSVRFLLDRGVMNCQITHSLVDPWDSASLAQMREQVGEVREFLLSYYRRHFAIPVGNFRVRPATGIFWCSAGQDRLSLAADEKLWGCRFLADYFNDNPEHPDFTSYCFGEILEFSHSLHKAYAAIIDNYHNLRQDAFSTELTACRKCRHLQSCCSCPALAAYSTGVIGRIPVWMCRMEQIWAQEVKEFWRQADKF